MSLVSWPPPGGLKVEAPAASPRDAVFEEMLSLIVGDAMNGKSYPDRTAEAAKVRVYWRNRWKAAQP